MFIRSDLNICVSLSRPQGHLNFLLLQKPRYKELKPTKQ